MFGYLRFRICILFCLMSILATASWAEVGDIGQAWHSVTVTDLNGWQLEDVTITWINDGTVLQIRRSDGATKSLTPDEIQQIHNADGVDITAEVGLRRTGVPQNSFERAANEELVSDLAVLKTADTSELPADTSAGLYSVAFDAGLGFATSTGTWFAGLDDGMNYQFGVRAMVTDVDYLRFVLRNQDFGSQEIEIYIDPEVFVVGVDLSLREYQLLLGRNASLTQGTQVKSLGYLEYGISVMEHIFETSDFGGDSDTITKTGLVLQGGVLVLLDRHLAFDFSANVTWKAGGSNDEGSGMLMGAHLGLAYLF